MTSGWCNVYRLVFCSEVGTLFVHHVWVNLKPKKKNTVIAAMCWIFKTSVFLFGHNLSTTDPYVSIQEASVYAD